MKKSRIVLTAVIAVIAVLYPFVCSTALAKTYYTETSSAVTRDVKLAFLSDFHSSEYGKDLCELTDAVNEFSPDAVIFGGDLFDERHSDENSLLLVEKMTAEYPCFYAAGNHELYKRKDIDELKAKLSEMGVRVLNGESEIIDGNVRIIGVDEADGREYADALSKAQSGCFNVLIYHYPEDFPTTSKGSFDLILSGHAHGGQVRIPFTGISVYAPNQGLFPKYTSGVFSENGTDMIVSRGLCRNIENLLIPRVFNRPEAVFITIEQEQNS